MDQGLGEASIYDEMLDTIEQMEAYAQAKGTMGGFDTGFPCINEQLDGLGTGLIIVGGQSNIGKSAFMMQLSWQTALHNQVIDEQHANKAYVMYFTLDDNAKDLLPRVIAIDQKIPINVVRTPAKFRDNVQQIARRDAGLKKLRESAQFYKMLDSVNGTDIEQIEAQIARHAAELALNSSEYKMVVFIDNFHDITTSMRFSDKEENKYDYIAGQLTKIATTYDIPIVCSAEFRKLNGIKRPTIDDIRESTKIGYESKAVMLCFNEVGIRGPNSNVFWTRPDKEDKQPVFEVHIAKNKFTSHKGRVFFEFSPELSYMQESDRNSSLGYLRQMA